MGRHRPSHSRRLRNLLSISDVLCVDDGLYDKFRLILCLFIGPKRNMRQSGTLEDGPGLELGDHYDVPVTCTM